MPTLEELNAQLEACRDALAASEARFRNVIDRNADGILIVDAGGFVRFANPAAEKLLGHTAAQLLETHFGFPTLAGETTELDVFRTDGVTVIVEMRVVETSWQGAPALLASLRDITERKAIEQALRESETRYKTLFDSASDAIFIHDLKGRFIEVNRIACQRLKYSRAELLRMTPMDIDEPAYAALVPERIARLRLQGHAVFETQHVRRDGTLIPTELSSRVIEYDGKPAILSIARDITERKESERVLRESEERLRTVVHNMPVMMDAIAADGTFLAWNRESERVTGYSAQEILDNPHAMEQLYPDPAYRERMLREVRESGYDFRNLEWELRGKDGQIKIIAWSNISRRFPIPGWDTWAVGVDITQWREAERAVRESRRELDRMLQTLVDGMVMVNSQGEIIYANPAAERILESPLAQLLGRRYDEAEWRQVDENGDIYPREQLPLAIVLREDREVEGMEHGILTDDMRTKWLSVNAAPLVDEKGALYGAIASFRDITERRQAAEALKRSSQELKRSNEELQQFAHVISHDLREPLRMIKSFIQLLARRYAGQLDPTADEFIAYAVDGAERMQALIHDLLEYSRVRTYAEDFRPVDCEEILAHALAHLRLAQAESGATVTHDPLPVICADRSQILQVFQNLVGNAFKFHAAAPHVHISARREKNAWIFSVADNGIGIEPQHFERIFVLFQRLHTRDEYPGTGIGLAVAKKIVEHHGGQIWVTSEPGQGSTFYFTLPALPEAPET